VGISVAVARFFFEVLLKKWQPSSPWHGEATGPASSKLLTWV